jgi:uncharacterized membrane protein
MANLSVLKFDGPDTADRALLALEGMQQRQLISVLDAAVVSYPEGASKPRTRQLQSTTAAGALGGMFWGTLLGLIFFVPLLGAAVGAATGALFGAFTDVGIDDEFIRQTREKVTPGTSALFALTSGETVDRVVEELKEFRPEVVTTNLSREQEDRLRAAFADTD